MAKEFFNNSERHSPFYFGFGFGSPLLVCWETGELFINEATSREFFQMIKLVKTCYVIN
jgi:hypothetical protein